MITVITYFIVCIAAVLISLYVWCSKEVYEYDRWPFTFLIAFGVVFAPYTLLIFLICLVLWLLSWPVKTLLSKYTISFSFNKKVKE